MSDDAISPQRFGLSLAAIDRIKRRRNLKDRGASLAIGVGGVLVIVFILLIFIYLLWEVLPLFGGAELEKGHEYTLQSASGEQDLGRTLFLEVEEQIQVAARVTSAGVLEYFNAHNGHSIEQIRLDHSAQLTHVVRPAADSSDIGLAYNDGSVLLLKNQYGVTFPNDVKTVVPELLYPFGQEPMQFINEPLRLFSYHIDEGQLVIAGLTASGDLQVKKYAIEEDFLTEALTAELEDEIQIAASISMPHNLLLGSNGRWLYLLDRSGQALVYDLQEQAPIGKPVQLTENGLEVTASTLLLGNISLLVGDSAGNIQQWFMVNGEQGKELTPIRSFKLGNAAISQIELAQRRKDFIAQDVDGKLAIFNTTAEREVLERTIDVGGLMVLSPRSNVLLQQKSDATFSLKPLHNEHPDVSFSALWQKVWYENYEQEEFIWQSSSASNDFEPKYSVMPLAFGTLKAAFYAMLLAVPLSICGAIYTAYFMAPEMRKMVKPTIELMEALPTVILGFLAGLWLAPIVEDSLPGVFALLILLPIVTLLLSFLWTVIPKHYRYWMPDGWQPLLIIPFIILTAWFSFAISGSIEDALFAGNMPQWLRDEFGIPYDQRNALIVGIAMGFAVVPTIFSITEDALFAVPKHLSFGSLALGASPWQTLVRVVLPTASPGIFSVVMIGFGRAVGETMIVLMATGNTPIMDWNIFEGLRTLSANIAVEMPEAEVDSTHFRILFLTALVLFIFTFLFNTSAEIVRHRLRKKYGTL